MLLGAGNWLAPCYTGSLHVIPAAEIAGIERRFMRVEEHVALRGAPAAIQSTWTLVTQVSVLEQGSR